MADTATDYLIGTEPNPWAGKAPGVCGEPGCTEPQRRLLRFNGGAYISDFCWEHGCVCLVCFGAIDDGEDLCEAHVQALGARYEQDLAAADRRAIREGVHPLQAQGKQVVVAGGRGRPVQLHQGRSDGVTP